MFISSGMIIAFVIVFFVFTVHADYVKFAADDREWKELAKQRWKEDVLSEWASLERDIRGGVI